jgi:hypothetical protein
MHLSWKIPNLAAARHVHGFLSRGLHSPPPPALVSRKVLPSSRTQKAQISRNLETQSQHRRGVLHFITIYIL